MYLENNVLFVSTWFYSFAISFFRKKRFVEEANALVLHNDKPKRPLSSITLKGEINEHTRWRSIIKKKKGSTKSSKNVMN